MTLYALLVLSALLLLASGRQIDRRQVVRRFNPQRNASSTSTPMQVGNGNFAFGVDVTGLQTFQPFGTLSSWGWHNISLPTTPGQTKPEDFTGLNWWTHGRLVNYAQPNPAQSDISTWMIQNPHRLNLGRVGFWFGGQDVKESDLSGASQTLDLYSGKISSSFSFNGTEVKIKTSVDPNSDTVALQIDSDLLNRGQLGLFFDFPYGTLNKFDAPFVGNFSMVARHATSLKQTKGQAAIRHDLDSTTYFTSLKWEGQASVTGPITGTHRYVLQPVNASSSLNLSVNFAPKSQEPKGTAKIAKVSADWWESYWQRGAFIDLTSSGNSTAVELQRRIILSQYLLAVNDAGNDPPQESGLTNNGWYGKFHMEMYPWHSLQWILWDRYSLLERSIGVYSRFLKSSFERAKLQGYTGARWGKMSDPSGRSAPGEINSLLIWQQPHALLFAQYDYRAHPNRNTLKKWEPIVTATADWMASYAFWNESSGYYDLGPPMYPVSENTNPNATRNPTFELAYWRFGLDIAADWKKKLGKPLPYSWADVKSQLAPLPVADGGYAIYEGVPNMWTDPETLNDHPAMTGIYGLLPQTPGLNLSVMRTTAEKVWATWDFPYSFGWDFPMLSMNAARLGDVDRAIGFLLDKHWNFDDVGMPIGGDRVATPYFPSSGGLLWAVALMAGGWEESDRKLSQRWPESWNVVAEGFQELL